MHIMCFKGNCQDPPRLCVLETVQWAEVLIVLLWECCSQCPGTGRCFFHALFDEGICFLRKREKWQQALTSNRPWGVCVLLCKMPTALRHFPCCFLEEAHLSTARHEAKKLLLYSSVLLLFCCRCGFVTSFFRKEKEEPRGGHQDGQRDGAPLLWERMRQLGLFSLRKRSFRVTW